MARRPLSWNKFDVNRYPNLVWRAKVDNRFLIEVFRRSSTTGKLYVFDHAKNDKEILDWDVVIPDDAKYDSPAWSTDKWKKEVLGWEKSIIDFVDNSYPERE